MIRLFAHTHTHALTSFSCTVHSLKLRVFSLFPLTHSSVPFSPPLSNVLCHLFSRLCSLSPVLCPLSPVSYLCSLFPVLCPLSYVSAPCLLSCVPLSPILCPLSHVSVPCLPSSVPCLLLWSVSVYRPLFFVPRRLSILSDAHEKTVKILPLAEHTRKFVQRWLIVQKIVSLLTQPAHAKILGKSLKRAKLKCDFRL
jgi:hypothetical protein